MIGDWHDWDHHPVNVVAADGEAIMWPTELVVGVLSCGHVESCVRLGDILGEAPAHHGHLGRLHGHVAD